MQFQALSNRTIIPTFIKFLFKLTDFVSSPLVLFIHFWKIPGAPRRQDIDVTAHSPSGRAVALEARHPPPSEPGTTASSAIFQPDEPGTWTIAITYKGQHIQVSSTYLIPFKVQINYGLELVTG